MYLSNRFPKNYRHQGYDVAPLACRSAGVNGWLHWVIYTPDGNRLAEAESLRQARELIEHDKLEKEVA